MSMKITLTAACLIAMTGVAGAQVLPGSLSPSRTEPYVTNTGGPDLANSGPGSTGSIATEGNGAGNVSNNPAGDGNSGDPSRASPNVASQRTQQ